jgi:hypothetical protein
MRIRLVLALAALAAVPGFAARADGPEVAAPAAAKSKWADHTGDVPFVVGYEAGTKAAAESGRPPLYFFTATW